MVSFCLCNQSINLKNGWEPRDSEGSMGREDSSCLSSVWRRHRGRTSGSSLCRWMNCLILSIMTPLKYIIIRDASNCSPCFNDLTFAKKSEKICHYIEKRIFVGSVPAGTINPFPCATLFCWCGIWNQRMQQFGPYSICYFDWYFEFSCKWFLLPTNAAIIYLM